MDEIEIQERWNKFVGCLIEARETFGELQKAVGGIAAEDFNDVSPKVAKLLSVYRRSRFEVMLPRFIDYYRAQGGLEAMLADIPKPITREEKKDGRGQTSSGRSGKKST